MEADTHKALEIPMIPGIQRPKINEQRRDPSQKMNHKHMGQLDKLDMLKQHSKRSNVQANTGLIIANPRQSGAVRGQQPRP